MIKSRESLPSFHTSVELPTSKHPCVLRIALHSRSWIQFNNLEWRSQGRTQQDGATSWRAVVHHCRTTPRLLDPNRPQHIVVRGPCPLAQESDWCSLSWKPPTLPSLIRYICNKFLAWVNTATSRFTEASPTFRLHTAKLFGYLVNTCDGGDVLMWRMMSIGKQKITKWDWNIRTFSPPARMEM